MATKRRSRNEDDEDDDDRPRRKSKKDDDEEEDEDRPRRRRKSRDDDDDEEKEEDRPRRRRKSRDDDDDDDDDDDEVEDLDEELSYEEQLAEFKRKKFERRKELENLSSGLKLFQKQIDYTLYGVGGCLAAAAGAYVMATQILPDLFWMIMALPALLALGVAVMIPMLVVQAVNKCKAGPDKSDSGNMLPIVMGVSFGSVALISFLSMVESIYFRNLARHLKDKPSAAVAKSVFMQQIFIGIGGPLILVGAFFLLRQLETLGYILLGSLGMIIVLLFIKMYVEMSGITNNLCLTIARIIKAEETIDW